MKKKGFTLIELLAVIVILAIISLIAVPIVLNIIDDARISSYERSSENILSAAEFYYIESLKDKNNNLVDEDIYEDVIKTIKGEKPKEGEIYVNEQGEFALALKYGDICFTKYYKETNFTQEKKETCRIKIELTQSIIDDFNSILDTKKYIPSALNKILDENGNVPAHNYYNDLRSRSIKELKAYDNKIFMGIGDWDNNTGPVKIIYYDTLTKKIITSGTIADEAVESFSIINNKLYTTGTDPKSSWGYGSYYIYNIDNNKWDKYEFYDGWIHVFDIEELNGKIFMCGSTKDTMKKTQIQVSYDNGKTFQNVKIVKDGKQLIYHSSLRFYGLEKYNGKIYAYSYFVEGDYDTRGIYEYDEENNQFNFIRKLGYSSINKEYGIQESIRYNVLHFKNNTVFNNYFVYVSGTIMYKTKDMNNFEKILTNTTDVVQDVTVHGDTLYTLSYQYNEDKTFSTRIYSTKDLENFKLLYEFKIDSFPFSIEYHNNNIYIGTNYDTESKDYIDYNSGLKTNSETGSLYVIDLDKINRSLSLNEGTKTINVTANGINYPVTYNLSNYDSTFTTTLTFDKNMTTEEREEQFSKLKNLDLVYALVKAKEENDLENLILYFDNIVNNIKLPEDCSNALEFADSVFSDKLDIIDQKFSINVENITKTEKKYEFLVTLRISY